jgi:hypothetical protein
MKELNNAKEINLSKEEKNQIREIILKHMEQSLISPYVDSKYNTSKLWLFFGATRRYMAPAIILVILILGTGTSIFAQNALPGNILYPVKIHVNENLESFLAVSPKAVAKVGINQAVRRLAEVDALLEKGELTIHSTEEIKNNFKYEIKQVDKQAVELESKGATTSAREIRDELIMKVKNHNKAFMKISEKESNKSNESEFARPQFEGSDNDQKKEIEEKLNRFMKSEDNEKEDELQKEESKKIFIPTIQSRDSSQENTSKIATTTISSTTPSSTIQSDFKDYDEVEQKEEVKEEEEVHKEED